MPAGSNGQVSVFASNDTDLIIDIDGYFAMPSGGSQSINHARTAATIPAFGPYTFTVNWTSAFPDTNCTVTCTPQVPKSGTVSGFYIFQVSAVNAGSVSVDAAANIYQGDYPVNFTIECMGVHD